MAEAAANNSSFSVWSSLRIFIGFYLAFMGYNVFQAVTPKKCDTVAEAELISQHGVSCLRPLFAPDERVDVYLYVSEAKPGKRGWSSKETYDASVPLWNKTGVRIDEAFEENVAVPLTANPLIQHQARNNGSLFVHAVVVRAGTSPNPSLTAKALNPRREAARERQASHEMRLDWLHASARLTRHLPPTRAKYTNLLKDATDRNRTEHEEPEFRTLHVPAPLVGQVGIDVQGALAWTGLAFALPSFASPSLALAVPRHAMLLLVAPYLYSQKAALNKERQAFERKRLAEEATAQKKYVKQRGGSVAHLRPFVSLRFVYDDGVYAPDEVSPALFQRYFRPKSGPHSGELRVKTERYPIVANDQGTDMRYVNPLYIDNNMLLQRDYRELSSNESLPDPVIKIEWAPMDVFTTERSKPSMSRRNCTRKVLGLSEATLTM